MKLNTYTARVWQENGWWCGQVVEVPGALAQERTRPSLMKSLHGALTDLLDLSHEDARAAGGELIRFEHEAA